MHHRIGLLDARFESQIRTNNIPPLQYENERFETSR